MKFQNDKYRTSRGGYSRFLEISCQSCSTPVCIYQKDGPGVLKRLYLDRMSGNNKADKLTCEHCKEELGFKYIYKKEGRPAYKLFVGRITKKLVKS